MKRRILLTIAVLAAGAVLLTACSSSDTKTDRFGSGVEGSSDGQGNDTLTGQDTPDGMGNDTSNDQGTQEGSSTDGQENGASGDPAGTDSQGEEAGEEPDGTVVPDDDAQAAEDENLIPDDMEEDPWSGSYSGDGESVTIVLDGEDTISFSFAQAGISGTAQVKGMQAVYNGDDHHVIVFDLNDTVLTVAVSSEEDFDASDSPLNGTYIRSHENPA